MRISSHRLDRSRSPGVRHSDVPPLPPPLHPDHDRIWGVTDEGPLAQVNMPAWRFTFVRCCGSLQASISHDLTAKPTSATSVARIDSCNCLSLMVTSDRSHKGLSPSITAPCPAQLRLRLRLQNTAVYLTPILSLNLEHKWGGGHHQADVWP